MKGFLPGCWVALGLAGAACADNGRDVGYLADASIHSAAGGRSVPGGSGGSADKGGSAGKAGASAGGISQGGSAGAPGGAEASDAAGGKPGSGGRSAGAGGSGGDSIDASRPPSGGGGSPPQRDAATDSSGLPLCGGDPCLSTTCVGLGCGAARCCKTNNGPVCVHGAERCPDEPAEITLQCWQSKTTATFDKTCNVDGDCIVENHWNGCCSVSAVGVTASQKGSFETFEQQTCTGPPPCGCCCVHIGAEDGNPVVPPATGRAICWNGACTAVGQ